MCLVEVEKSPKVFHSTYTFSNSCWIVFENFDLMLYVRTVASSRLRDASYEWMESKN